MDQNLNANHFALFMFLSLSQQAEGWAYILKGKVNMRTKQLLNNYLNAAKSLYTHMQGQHDINDLLDDSEVWTKFMQLLLNSSLKDQQKLFVLIKETLHAQEEI